MLGRSIEPSNLASRRQFRSVAIRQRTDTIPPRHGCLWACGLQENREDGSNPSRSRRCNRGRTPQKPLSLDAWEGAVSRSIREPEDLP